MPEQDDPASRPEEGSPAPRLGPSSGASSRPLSSKEGVPEESEDPSGTTGLVEMDPNKPDHHARIKTSKEIKTEQHEQGHVRRADVHRKFLPAIRWMTYAEIVAYLLVAITLLVMALVVIYKGGDDVYSIIRDYVQGTDPTEVIVDALSNFLFVVILMELLATLITHIRHETFQIKPFLIIGIISGVRQILLLGARLSLEGRTMPGIEWRHSQIELGVNVGIDLVLVLALVLLRHFKVESQSL